jgi:hypothetical protein
MSGSSVNDDSVTNFVHFTSDNLFESINHQTTDAVKNDATTDHRTIDTALLSEDLKDEALCRSRADTRSTSESMELESDIATGKAFSITLDSKDRGNDPGTKRGCS